MPAPACRVFALPVAVNGRPAQDGLDAPSQTARRFRFRCPDGIHARVRELLLYHGDFTHTLFANYRSGYHDQQQEVEITGTEVPLGQGPTTLVQLDVPSYTVTNYQLRYMMLDDSLALHSAYRIFWMRNHRCRCGSAARGARWVGIRGLPMRMAARITCRLSTRSVFSPRKRFNPIETTRTQ